MTIILMSQLVGALSLIQGYEFYRLQPILRVTWEWQALQKELPFFLRLAYENRGTQVINWLRISAGLGLVISPHAGFALLLLALHILTMLRFLGTFNGGSDYMTLILLVCLSTLLCYPSATHAMLWYLTLQLCLSYFLAGFYKVRNRHWRDGTALQLFLPSQQYEKNAAAQRIAADYSRAVSWLIMIFELAFPVCLISKQLALIFITCGIFFHLCNTYFFGLNRFFWAWLAAYPALYYCAWP